MGRVQDRHSGRSGRPPADYRLRPLGPRRPHPTPRPRQTDLTSGSRCYPEPDRQSRHLPDLAQEARRDLGHLPSNAHRPPAPSENHQGPYIARAFVTWAVRSTHASGVSIPDRPQRSFYRPLDADDRWTIARQLLNDDSFETRDRVAGLMVFHYGQTPAKISRLTTAHVIHDEKGVALQL